MTSTRRYCPCVEEFGVFPGDEVVPATAPLSMSRGSLARFVADASGFALAVIASVITARVLGPADKGVYSTIVLLSGLFIQLSNMGLGDAATVLVGRRHSNRSLVLKSSLIAVSISSIASVLLLGTVAYLQLGQPPPASDDFTAIIVAVVGLPIAALMTLLIQLANIDERITSTSLLLVAQALTATILLFVFLVPFSLGIAGAIAAGVVGSAVAAIGAVPLVRPWLARRSGWDRDYLITALRLGIPLQVSYLLMLLSVRVDLLVVINLAGRAEAGYYSVALTVGGLAGSVSLAITYAVFPRLAKLGDPEAQILILRLARYVGAASLAAAAVLCFLAPLVIPAAFGDRFRPAIIPAIVMLISGVVSALQWALTRGAAARGDSRAVLQSFGVTLVVMLVLDFLLIPFAGLIGAALAAGAANTAGLITVVVRLRRKIGLDPRALMPRPTDFVELWSLVRHAVVFRKDR